MQDKVLQQQLEIVIDQLNDDPPNERGFAGTVQQAIKRIEELEAIPLSATFRKDAFIADFVTARFDFLNKGERVEASKEKLTEYFNDFLGSLVVKYKTYR